MCPDDPAACPPPYSGDPVIYAQEAAHIVWPVVPVLVILGMILLLALITWSVYEGTK